MAWQGSARFFIKGLFWLEHLCLLAPFDVQLKIVDGALHEYGMKLEVHTIEKCIANVLFDHIFPILQQYTIILANESVHPYPGIFTSRMRWHCHHGRVFLHKYLKPVQSFSWIHGELIKSMLKTIYSYRFRFKDFKALFLLRVFLVWNKQAIRTEYLLQLSILDGKSPYVEDFQLFSVFASLLLLLKRRILKSSILFINPWFDILNG